MRKTGKRLSALLLAAVMALSLLPVTALAADGAAPSGTTFDVLDYGADPTGVRESSHAVQDAIAAAKELDASVQKTILFPKGEYHFYADYSQVRKLYITNTVGTNQNYTQKRLGILLEDMSNVTIDGGGSLFIFHGDVTALAAIGCTNITFQNFSIDHASPEVVDVTVESRVEGENAVIAYIPPCYDYTISGNAITWKGEAGPETGTPYWQGDNDLAEWGQMYDMKEGITTRAGGYVSGGALLRSNISSITELGDDRVKITYTGPASLPKVGTCYQLRWTTRTTAGMFFWESDGVTLRHMKVHFLHGFGLVGQLSKNFTIDDVDFSAREGTGRASAGFADFIQMSSVGGKVSVTNCNFSNPHDDPINIHGTFLVVKEVSNNNRTFKLRYMHDETAGFPQYYVGDTVDFSTYGTMIPVANSARTVTAVEDPPEDATSNEDLRTITITVDEPVEGITANNYVVENVTYTPEVLIENCRFAQTPTRGVLVTTRKPVVIRNNYFDRMGMAAIFISCDAQSWYESGHVENVLIENNTFIIQNRFRGDAGIDAGILIRPTNNTNDPTHRIHSNIRLEGNTFYLAPMDGHPGYAVWAKSVNGFTVKDNAFLRYEPNVTMSLSAASRSLTAGGSQATRLDLSGAQQTHQLFGFEACDNIVFENNSYDDGLNLGVSLGQYTTAADFTRTGADEALALGGSNQLPAVANVQYFSSDPSVATVDAHGVVHGVSAGTADVTAYTVSGERVFRSAPVTFTVTEGGAATATPAKIQVTSAHSAVEVGASESFSAAVTDSAGGAVSGTAAWSVRDAATGNATANASITTAGVFTATRHGVYEVAATQGGVSGSKLITVSKPQGLDTGVWTVDREVAGTWSLDDESGQVTIRAQGGGDWGSDDTGGHDFFLMDPPASGDFTITVKLDSFTCQQSNCWCEAGLVVWKDKDNYVAVARKNANGSGALALSSEHGGSPGEGTPLSDAAQQAIYLKLAKTGDSYAGSYSADGTNWTAIRTAENSLSDCKIGFYATNAGNGHDSAHRYVLEDFTLGGNQVPLVSANRAPTASGATLTPGSGSVALTYDYSDPDSDAESGSVVVWYVSDSEDGNYTRVPGSAVSSDGKTLTVDAATSEKWVKAVVVPVDAQGRPGTPVGTSPARAPQQTSVPDDATLSSLGVSGGSLTPAFSPDVTDYTVTLPGTATGVELAATAAQADADVTGVGNVTLTGAETTATVTVTAADHTTKDYVITIKRAADTDAGLTALSVTAGSDAIAYSPSTRYYQLVADEDVSALALSLTPAAPGASVSVRLNGKEKGDYEDPMTLPLAGGLNDLELFVTAPDGISVAIYRVVIVKYASHAATLDSLTVNSGGDLLPLADNAVVEVTGDTATIHAAPANAGATVTLRAGRQEVPNNAPFDLTENATEVTVRVTAEDGVTRETYAFTLVKSAPVPGDKTALVQALADANAAKDGVQTKPDGTTASQVEQDTRFVTTSEMQTLIDAIAAAQTVADAANATQAEVDAALAGLSSALAAFTSAIKTGVKEPSSGGSPSIRPATPAAERRDDGSQVTTVTRADGTEIETVARTDGSKAEKVTDPQQNVTITVTDGEGEELAKVEIPAVLPQPEAGFTDVPTGHWAEDAIQTAVALGLFQGVGGNNYDMTAPMTRGSLAVVLHRLSQGKTDYQVTFTDVAQGQYYTEGVAWAAKANVVKGVSADVFAPDQAITREQLAVMMARYAKLIGMDAKASAETLEQFSDGEQTGAWAVDGVAWCVENGILKGKGGAVLEPTAQVTRAEVAVVLQRFIELLK